jgi:hypothetical protein
MSHKKVRWIDRELVMSPYYMGLARDEGEFRRELKRLKVADGECDPWIPEGADGGIWELERDDRQLFIVCIRPGNRDRIEVYGLLVHEAVHAWRRIKKSLGEGSPSSEFEAYAVQNIASRLMDAYRFKKGKGK